MKKLLAGLAASFLILSVHAQALQRDFGKDLVSTHDVTAMIKADSVGNIFYLTAGDRGERYLERQALSESKMTQLGEIYDHEADRRKELERIVFTDTWLGVFTKKYDKAAKTVTFELTTFGYDGKQKGSPKEVLVINLKKKQNAGSSMVTASPDFSHFMIYYRSTASAEIQMYAFDSNWKQLYEHIAVLVKDSKKGYVSAGGFGINNDGTLHYVQEKTNVINREYQTSYMFYAVNGGVADSLKLSPGGIGMGGYRIEDEEGQILIFGITGEKGMSSGIYFANYSTTEKKMTREVSNDFTREMFVTPGVVTPKNATTPNVGYRYKVGQIMKTPTGGYYMLVETAFMYSSQSSNGMTVTQLVRPDHHVVSMTSDGAVNWISTIFCNQTGVKRSAPVGIGFGGVSVSVGVKLRNDDFGLYFSQVAMIGDGVTILTNDDPLNTPQPKDHEQLKAVTKTDKLQGCMIHIDNTGAITKEKVKGPGGVEIKIYPTISYGGEGMIATLFYNDDVSGVMIVKE